MSWLRRLLTETEDDGRFRSALGMFLGACFVLIPLPFEVLDLRTVLLDSFMG